MIGYEKEFRERFVVIHQILAPICFSTNFWIQDIDLWPNTNHLKGTEKE